LVFLVFLFGVKAQGAAAPDKLIGIHSARVMSQSLPWVAEEAGLFKKYNLDFHLVFISSSSIVTAALLGGDAEMTLTGGIGNVRAYVQGSTDVVFVGGVKNMLTHSIVGGTNIKRPEDLKSKRIGVSRIGGNSHYFTIQALRRFNLEPGRDFVFIQTGGEPEAIAALIGGGIDAAAVTAPADAQELPRLSLRFVRPRSQNSYSATAFVTKRSVIAKRPQVVSQFMRAMAEASKIMLTDREFIYKVLGKYLRLTDRKILESSYNTESKALEPRLAIKLDSLQAILDEIAPTDARAKKVKPQELVDHRYVDDLEKSGFFDQLWAKK
jgi:ABC-type nitrate/sulfonate/bicarbonate transport system substrate-binding protein